MTSLSRSLRRAGCCGTLLSVLANHWCSAADPHPSIPPPVIPECLGVNIHFTDPKPGEIEMLAAAGFKWVRMDFTWAGTEREKGVYDFSAYDRLMAHLDKHKLRALFILDYGNKLYDPDGSSPHTDESRAAFARWAAAAVAHFKGKGYIWELWNEPNIAQFWKPKPNVEDYVALAKATADALRDARLIAGRDGSPSRPPEAPAAKEFSKNKSATDGSASRPYRECLIGPAVSTIDLTFLEACFKAGLLDVWDAVSVHPYRQTAPESVEEEYRSVRLLIRKYAPKDKAVPVISSEWGYSSAWKDFDEEKQAKYLPRQFLTNIANDVALSIWYDWRDDGPDPKEPEHHFGLVHHEYREGKDPVFEPKPAYQAAKTITRQLVRMKFNKRLSETSWDELLLFSGSNAITFVHWSRLDRWRRDLPPGLSFFGRFHELNFLGGKQRTEMRTKENYPLGEWPIDYDGPSYLVPEKWNDVLATVAAWPRLSLEYFTPAPGEIVIPAQIQNFGSKSRGMWLETISSAPRGDMITCMGGKMVNKPVQTMKPRQRIDAESRVQLHSRQRQAVAQQFVFMPPNSAVVMENSNRTFTAQVFGAVRFAQVAPILVTNGVEGFLEPVSADRALARIENCSGEKLTGQFGPWDPEHVDPQDRVQFENGQRIFRVLRPATRVDDGREKSYLSEGISFSDGTIVFLPSITWRALSQELIATSGIVTEGDPTTKADATIEQMESPDASSAPASKAIRVQFRTETGHKFFRLVSQPGEALDDQPAAFGIWLHGDATGCQARIRFADATGQTFQPDGPKIDWTGWRYVTFPMQSTNEKPLAHWGGANDGVIHYPIKWDTIFLLDNVSRQPVEGEVYLSAPTLIY